MSEHLDVRLILAVGRRYANHGRESGCMRSVRVRKNPALVGPADHPGPRAAAQCRTGRVQPPWGRGCPGAGRGAGCGETTPGWTERTGSRTDAWRRRTKQARHRCVKRRAGRGNRFWVGGPERAGAGTEGDARPTSGRRGCHDGFRRRRCGRHGHRRHRSHRRHRGRHHRRHRCAHAPR